MLSVLIALPLLGAILVGIMPTAEGSRFRLVTSLFSGLSLAWAVSLGNRFLDHSAVQLQEYLPWLDAIGLSYRLSIDGLSYSLVILNTLLTTIAIYSSSEAVTRPRLYYSLLLLINGAVSGAFLANNFLLF
ncbi:MAG: NAD(P)H-quinone oxidoreductase subunit D4, partial [Cyanobacteria bacterium]|nr:NAD(P)H-quinone oxidoreductase subunit D4 [Cyanobacteriota bacterium]MDW8202439.1 NAD(P)H-quinone oxidoreductase subunit D4 [Cyanobacteriota bacterium SKYGB_h_bin112]